MTQGYPIIYFDFESKAIVLIDISFCIESERL